MINRIYGGFAALGMALAVALGAYGAHGLKTKLIISKGVAASQYWLEIWHTAVTYQFIHCLALLILVSLTGKICPLGLRWAARFFMLGVCLFPGSIYLMVLTQDTSIRYITPVGGTSFIIAWLFFFVAIVRSPRGEQS